MARKVGKSTAEKYKGKGSRNRKKATVVTQKMNHLMRPKGMTLAEWQVALRRQQAAKEIFAISQIDERFSPGEYQVRNALTTTYFSEKIYSLGKVNTTSLVDEVYLL